LTYLVTGASSGIGNAVARRLAMGGNRVLAIARSEAELRQLEESFPDAVEAVPADLSTSDGIRRIIKRIQNDNSVAGLVHSAGSAVPLQRMDNIDAEELQRHFRIHVTAQLSLYQSVTSVCELKRMLFVDSYSASTPREHWAAYSIVKAAAQMLARCSAAELPRTRTIRVLPGAVNTRIVRDVLQSDSPTAAAFSGLKEKGLIAEPADVASFITAILVNASDSLLNSVDAWEYNDPEHRKTISDLLPGD